MKKRPNMRGAVEARRRSLSASAAEDAQLVDRVKSGEAEAYGELVRKYQDRLFNTCWRVCGNLEDARDLTQDAFLKAYERLSGFREQSSFYTWIYRVAVNLAISHRRNARRHRVVSIDEGAPAAGTQAEELARRVGAGGNPEPVASAGQAELQGALAHALGALDDEHRAVVVLRDIEGFDYQEIADILEIQPGTVKSRLHRARMALRSAILPSLRPGSSEP